MLLFLDSPVRPPGTVWTLRNNSSSPPPLSSASPSPTCTHKLNLLPVSFLYSTTHIQFCLSNWSEVTDTTTYTFRRFIAKSSYFAVLLFLKFSSLTNLAHSQFMMSEFVVEEPEPISSLHSWVQNCVWTATSEAKTCFYTLWQMIDEYIYNYIIALFL